MLYLDIILTGVMLCITSYTDIKEEKIPNIIVFPMTLLGLLNTALLFDYYSMLVQLGLGIIWLLIGFILYRFHKMGAGDVKLIFAMICLLGIEYALIVVCLGMVLGVFYAGYKKVIVKESGKIMIPLAIMCFLSFIFVTAINFVYLVM